MIWKYQGRIKGFPSSSLPPLALKQISCDLMLPLSTIFVQLIQYAYSGETFPKLLTCVLTAPRKFWLKFNWEHIASYGLWVSLVMDPELLLFVGERMLECVCAVERMKAFPLSISLMKISRWKNQKHLTKVPACTLTLSTAGCRKRQWYQFQLPFTLWTWGGKQWLTKLQLYNKHN